MVHWTVIPTNLQVSTACTICPWLDDYYERWSAEEPQSILTFSVVPTPTVTHVVVTYPTPIARDAEWVREAFDDTNQLYALIDRLAFTESEDTAVSPHLWESLSEETRRKVAHAIRHEMYRGPLREDDVPKVVSL